jgi:hypothetical protein
MELIMVCRTLLTPFILFIGLLAFSMPNTAIHAKLETTRLTFLREALEGKKLRDKALLLCKGIVATEVWLAGKIAHELSRSVWNILLTEINTPHSTQGTLKSFFVTNNNLFITPGNEKRAAAVADALKKGIQSCNNYINSTANPHQTREMLTVTAIIGGTISAYVSYIGYLMVMVETTRPVGTVTSYFSWPFGYLINWPNVYLFAIMQRLFFDYDKNLIRLLKTYNRNKIPTIFQEKFDILAAEYTATKKISMTRLQQINFVQNILRQIQDELLEPITIPSVPMPIIRPFTGAKNNA